MRGVLLGAPLGMIFLLQGPSDCGFLTDRWSLGVSAVLGPNPIFLGDFLTCLARENLCKDRAQGRRFLSPSLRQIHI